MTMAGFRSTIAPNVVLHDLGTKFPRSIARVALKLSTSLMVTRLTSAYSGLVGRKGIHRRPGYAGNSSRLIASAAAQLPV